MKATRFRVPEPKIYDIKLRRTKAAVAVDDNVVNELRNCFLGAIPCYY